jgi:hypothetical protein
MHTRRRVCHVAAETHRVLLSHCSGKSAHVGDTKSAGGGGGGGGGGGEGGAAALPTEAAEVTHTAATQTLVTHPLPVAGGPLNDNGIHIIFST